MGRRIRESKARILDFRASSSSRFFHNILEIAVRGARTDPRLKVGTPRCTPNRTRLHNCAPGKITRIRFAAFAIALALALLTAAFGQQKPGLARHDTGSDLLWKKLETRVEEIAARLDGVMGVAILVYHLATSDDLMECLSRGKLDQNRHPARIVSPGSGSARWSERHSNAG